MLNILNRRAVSVAAMGLALALTGCVELSDNQRPSADVKGDTVCYECHGDIANPDSAPPPAYWLPSGYVDAHRDHLDGGTPCETCHIVPEQVDSPGHIDTQLPAELVWSGLAVNDGATPEYDFEASTCDGTYCHGATLIPGGTLTDPNWTILDGSQAACGTCHENPPDLPHPDNDQCGDCHGEVIDNDGNWVNQALHVDGIVQLSDVDCNVCHGDDDSSAPPFDLAGSDDTSEPGVGAHREHLGAASWHGELTCDQCHVVPRDIDDEGHLDGPPADIVWGDLASADDADPDYDYETNTCDGVYCHGGTLEDGAGSNTEPLWTLVDGSQDSCGTCHGLPPGGGHVGRTDCDSCHGMVVSDLGFVNPDLHIDGIVQVEELGCGDCHGGEQASAPPIDTSGNASTHLPGVGAHRAHLGNSGWHAALTCDQCHVVPENTDDPGHNDTALPAELVWGDLATADDADPDYDPETSTCDGTYCHGSTLPNGGGSNTVPDWTIVNGTQAQCGTCHGLPPDAPHPSSAACESCHSEVVDSTGFVNPDLHINGTVEVDALGCDSCHGLNGASAPPLDTLGRRSTTFSTVGAHRDHLRTNSIWHADIPCDECHVVPDAIDDPDHNNGVTELDWGPVASEDSADPNYDFETATCDGVYCHGGTMTTDTNATLQEPVWNIVDSTQDACGTCHGLPPQPDHPNRDDCSTCHGSVVGDPPGNFVDKDLHINGTINF